MAFIIENNDVVFNANQSRVFSTDIAALVQGLKHEGVISGAAVTAQGSPDMTVAVAAGVVIIAGLQIAVSSGNVTITAADGTHPRIDLIVVDNAGAKSATAGTPAANPQPAAIPSDSVLLAMVYVPASDTTIATNQITDKRVIVPAVPFWTEIRRGSDKSVSSNTTPADDGVLQFDMVAGVVYEFELYLVYASPAGAGTPDFKGNFAGPATLDGLITNDAFYNTNDSVGAGGNAAVTATLNVGTAANKRSFSTRGWAVSSGGGTGASGFRLQWSQGTSGVNATTVYAESVLRYRAMTP